MENYFLQKLSEINYQIAIHEGAANYRLASQSYKILLLPKSEVPAKYSKIFNELTELIITTLKTLPTPGLLPVKLNKIRNKSASKFIACLMNIEIELKG